MSGIFRMCWRDERGVTGIETAIVLIAFVVVASVFAFTIMSTGITATAKSKETVLGGMAETSATIVLRGSVIAVATTTKTSVSTLSFQVTIASRGGGVADLSSSGTIVSYTDAEQHLILDFVASPASTPGWGTTWIVGDGPLLQSNERVEIVVNLNGLTPLLAARTEFTVQLRPNVGAVLPISRTTPAELTGVTDLH